MIDMLKRHEIQVLRRAGHTLAEVATLSGVSVGTVRRVVDETAVTTVDNDAERDRRQIGRPPKAEAYREVLLAALADDATLRTVELLGLGLSPPRRLGHRGGSNHARRARRIDADSRKAQPIEVHRRSRPRKRHIDVRRDLPRQHRFAVTLHGDRPVPVDRPLAEPDDDVPDVTPGSTRTRRAAGSTRTDFMSDKSSSRPPSQTALPAVLWPPPRTASISLCSRARLTVAMTSAAPAARTTSAGRRSIIAFQMVRAAS